MKLSDREQALLDTLQETANGCKSVGISPGIEEFVLSHGQFFVPRRLPKEFRCGQPRLCYANSYRMLLRHGRRHQLTYVEGYALANTTRAHAVLHAWCVDAEGYILDRTWRRPADAYFGIAFRREYVIAATQRRKQAAKDDVYGLLDDWEGGFPLLTDLANRPEVWKESIDVLATSPVG